MKTPDTELIGERCTLRPLRRGDKAAIVQHANNRKVWRGLYDIFPHPYTLNDAEEWIGRVERGEATNVVVFAIVVDGEVCGTTGLGRIEEQNSDCLSMGYWLGEDYWGRGIATDAVRLMVRYAFDAIGCNRLEARCYGWNTGSARVLEKCGFTLEGRLRRRMLKDGEHCDQLIYGMLPEDDRP